MNEGSFLMGLSVGIFLAIIIQSAYALKEKRNKKNIPPPSGEVYLNSLCWTGTTLYALDFDGRVWFVSLRSGKWELHGNPNMKNAEQL